MLILLAFLVNVKHYYRSYVVIINIFRRYFIFVVDLIDSRPFSDLISLLVFVLYSHFSLFLIRMLDQADFTKFPTVGLRQIFSFFRFTSFF